MPETGAVWKTIVFFGARGAPKNQTTNINPMAKQLPVLNSLRGIAALGILLHHITIYFLPELGKFTSQFTPFCAKNYLWVDFFFILSGFVAGHSCQNRFSHQVQRSQFVSFIISRFTRLYPLHFVTLAILVIIELVYLYFYSHLAPSIPLEHLPIPFDSENSLTALLFNVLFLQAVPQWSSWNQPSWALSAIWLVAFTLPFTIAVILHAKRRLRILVVSLCLTTLMGIYWQKQTLDLLSWLGLIRCFTETVLGVVAYTIYKRINKIPSIYGTSYMLYFLLLLSFLTLFTPMHHGVTVVLFCALILCGACIQSDPVFTHPLLLFLGKISFSIYLVHWLPFQMINKFFLITTGVALHQHLTQPQLIVVSIFYFFLTIPLSYLFYRYIET